MQLTGKTVLIPGASRPIGRGIARIFAEAGAMLILPVFDWPESIIELTKEFTAEQFDFHTIPADLRKKDDALRITEYILAERGGLDYLINNIERGGMPVVHGSYDLPHNDNQWDLELETTLKAKWLLFQCCRPLLLNNPGGAVVNISSIAGNNGRSGPGALFFSDGYSAANRAVQSLTETWAREVAPSVRVNEVTLGLIQARHGEGTRGWTALTEHQRHELIEQILLERTGRVKEVAELVFFLAVSATYMTGSVIKMDGGFSLGATRVADMPPGIL